MTEKEEQLYKDRLKKLEGLREAGIDPYPAKTKRTHTVAEILEQFSSLFKDGKQISLAGRIRGLRGHGALIFGNLEDGSGSIQFMLREDLLSKKQFDIFKKYVDIGDFISATGKLIETKRGEKTLEVKDFDVLTKSLRALPEQWHGLQDIETRLRQRYLDLIANPEVREMFRRKAVFWQTTRDFLNANGFLEVETPVLENVPGGAEAEPFITHHNALNRDFYLRISLELPLKRLLVGGYEKVFEIGRIFRNEGISTTHLQDYTQLEFYWAYASFEDLMEFVQKMYQQIIKKTYGKLKIPFRGIECDWSGNWKKVNYIDLFKKWTGIDLETSPDEELKKYANKRHIKYKDFIKRGRLIDLIFKKERAERSIHDKKPQKPFFLINQPIELEPLAKRVEGNPRLVQRMQVMAHYMELGKGFGELNDPIDQRKRFEEQMKLREAGDREAQMLDEDYMEAIEYGMPLAAGFGMSERLFTVLEGKSVRETVIFPPMREK